MKYTVLYAAALLPLLSGCGADISYKMGGGADQLRLDRQTCGGNEAPNYESCMKAKGWGTLDIRGKAEEAEMEPESAVAEAPAAATPAAPTQAVTSAAPSSAAAPKAKIDPRDMANVKPAPRPKAPKDPNARVTVNSWWKPGGSGATHAIGECVAELGDAHKPDYAKHTASQGLVNCMKKRGWYAL